MKSASWILAGCSLGAACYVLGILTHQKWQESVTAVKQYPSCVDFVPQPDPIPIKRNPKIEALEKKLKK